LRELESKSADGVITLSNPLIIVFELLVLSCTKIKQILKLGLAPQPPAF
jgi:hypothetical protein